MRTELLWVTGRGLSFLSFILAITYSHLEYAFFNLSIAISSLPIYSQISVHLVVEYSNLICIRKYYTNYYGSRRKYAYLHEEEPKSPLESSVREDVPVPNSDNIPFVSLNDVGDHAGDFHPSGSVGRNIVARSMDLGDDSEEVTTGQTITEADIVHEASTEPNVEDKELNNEFAAEVVELDVNDYINNNEVFKLLSKTNNK